MKKLTKSLKDRVAHYRTWLNGSWPEVLFTVLALYSIVTLVGTFRSYMSLAGLKDPKQSSEYVACETAVWKLLEDNAKCEDAFSGCATILDECRDTVNTLLK